MLEANKLLNQSSTIYKNSIRVGGEDMKRAKLIKREEIIEREQTVVSEGVESSATGAATQQPSVVKLTFDAVRKWATERQSGKYAKPREAFDALFVEPRTNE
jgi:hypothetical protein